LKLSGSENVQTFECEGLRARAQKLECTSNEDQHTEKGSKAGNKSEIAIKRGKSETEET
jgi:hypothetical protein